MKKIFFILIMFAFSLHANKIPVSSKPLDKDSFRLISGSCNPNLAAEVAYILGVNLSKIKIGRFNDGEININIEESIRGKTVYIMQSICSSEKSSVNDNLIELYLLIRACKRASASKIIPVIPYFGYARQDRKEIDRVPISASDIAILLENAGIDHIITLDLHSGQIQGFFHNVSIDNLMTSIIFLPYFERKNFKELVVVAPDAGALGRAKSFIEGLHQYGVNAKFSMIIKHRSQGIIDEMYLIGDVKNKEVIIVDDMCDTGSTLIKASEELKKNGAKRIYGCVTHPVFSKNAIDRIKDSSFSEFIVSDTIPITQEISSNIVQVSIAPLLAEAIRRTQNGDSLSNLFIFK